MTHSLTNEQLNSLIEQLQQVKEAIAQLYWEQDNAKQELREA